MKYKSICPITYEPIDTNALYSKKGLRLLSPKLTTLDILPWDANEQRQQARSLATKISIQGIQAKLSAKLNIKKHQFEIVSQYGKYILKPQSELFNHLPENEDLTMRLASMVGIETPLHGLIYCKDKTMTYFIKRFDRIGHKQKIAVEDFAQLGGMNRDTKYRYSMEKIVKIIDEFTTFPKLEKKNLLLRVIFNFVIGNEDMHLKNYSIITKDGISKLAPAYDFLNSTLAMQTSKEEIALPLRGKKSQLRRKDFIDYYGIDILNLNQETVNSVLNAFNNVYKKWYPYIQRSFLPHKQIRSFNHLIQDRLSRLGL